MDDSVHHGVVTLQSIAVDVASDSGNDLELYGLITAQGRGPRQLLAVADLSVCVDG